MTNSSEDFYDWNMHQMVAQPPQEILLNDETLRDGIQSPSVRVPSIQEKLQLLHLMEDLSIDSADIGYPSASPKMYRDVTMLARAIKEGQLGISPNCAARTHRYDITPIIEISHEVDIPIEVCAFLGTSPIRKVVERWSLPKLENLARSAIRLCQDSDMPSMFVTEDTTRSDPNDLKQLYLAAAHEGAEAICLADTVGHATPKGTYFLVSYVKQFLKDEGYGDIRVDWHGHRDRGLSIANSIAAIEAGADRIHGTALGIGERCGNTPMDQLLVNLSMLGWIDNDLTKLSQYTLQTSSMVDIPVPINYPIIGKDAFRTATGVHAAAIIKAEQLGRYWIDTVYSSVPAAKFGRKQEIEIGPMSGQSNVKYKLRDLGLAEDEKLVRGLLEFAKQRGRILSDHEIHDYVKQSDFILTPS